MNLLQDFGYKDADINKRIKESWKTLFEGKKSERIYFEDADGAYILDTGYNDVRSEGMGYGMMISLQMDRKDVFDKLWTWTKNHLYINEGEYKGYFHFACNTDGSVKMELPRPDGEEYISLALLFASHRWGNGKGIFNYEKESLSLLTKMLHSKHPLWNKKTFLIKNEMEKEDTDVSYNLPHFYELYAMFAPINDSDFWNKAADASRKFIVSSCHPKTGLSAEYTDESGKPLSPKEHGTYFSHSYVVAANIGLYSMWFGDSPDLGEVAQKLITFFDKKQPEDFMEYLIDGKATKKKSRHPLALCACIAEAAVALERSREPISPAVHAAAKRAVKRFWDTPLRKGKRRYYDNIISMMALLCLSGIYKVY